MSYRHRGDKLTYAAVTGRGKGFGMRVFKRMAVMLSMIMVVTMFGLVAPASSAVDEKPPPDPDPEPKPECTDVWDYVDQLTGQVDVLHVTVAVQAASLVEKDVELAVARERIARKDATIKRLRLRIKLLTPPPAPKD